MTNQADKKRRDGKEMEEKIEGRLEEKKQKKTVAVRQKRISELFITFSQT